jgi:hypothetical protein
MKMPKGIATAMVLGGVTVAGTLAAPAQAQPGQIQCNQTQLSNETIIDCSLWDGYTSHAYSKTICYTYSFGSNLNQCRVDYF